MRMKTGKQTNTADGAARRRVVLVGTYKGDQLKAWPGWYCWPLDGEQCCQCENVASSQSQLPIKGMGKLETGNIGNGNTSTLATLSSVTELRLYRGTADERRYRTEFVGVKTREELIRDTNVINEDIYRFKEEDIPGLRSQIVTLNVQTSLRSQIVTLNKGQGQHLKYMPYAFTEQGVAMLSSVLKSDTAIRVSIQIMDAFSAMRRALASVAPILSRLDVVERRQIADQSCNEERFETIFKAMDGGDFPPQKVFFDGKHYDAFSFARKLVRKAVAAFHDRFLILDGTELYHLGASLKDLGRKYCAVTKMDSMFIPSIMQRI